MTDYSLNALRGRLEERYLKHRGYGSGRAFVTQLLNSVGDGDILLDAGCGESLLRNRLSPEVHYVGLDRYAGVQDNEYTDWNMRPGILGDVHQLPIISGCCKTVALMHVLEHTQNPTRVFAEVFRVLEPGGYLFVDVPFLHEIHHAPHDYFRYTPFSLNSLAQAACLEVVEIRPSGGYFRALSHLLEEAPAVVSGTTLGGSFLRVTVAYPLKGLGWLIRKLEYLLDLYDEKQCFTCGYHCVFRKPSHDSR